MPSKMRIMQNLKMLVAVGGLVIVTTQHPTTGQVSTLYLESPAFSAQEMIPRKYTCDGQDINPPLAIRNIPEKTRSLALIVDDPDAPMGLFTHWILWNIPPNTMMIQENTVPKGAIEGHNSFNQNHYGGPCPPGRGTHHYQFRLFALDSTLAIPAGSSRQALLKAMEHHVVGQTMMVGLYRRHS